MRKKTILKLSLLPIGWYQLKQASFLLDIHKANVHRLFKVLKLKKKIGKITPPNMEVFYYWPGFNKIKDK